MSEDLMTRCKHEISARTTLRNVKELEYCRNCDNNQKMDCPNYQPSYDPVMYKETGESEE